MHGETLKLFICVHQNIHSTPIHFSEIILPSSNV